MFRDDVETKESRQIAGRPIIGAGCRPIESCFTLCT
jgi:hypothetical protein